MPICKDLIRLKKASLHPPPALDTGGDIIPWALLEYKAYVADRRNDTTAVAESRCGREIQVSFFAARPPRVSYLCVFCRPAATEEHQDEEEVEMIPMEPQVVATDENLILLRIVVSPEKDIIGGNDLYVYRPAGDDGPSLTRLPRPPRGTIFNSNQVGILSCCPDDRSTGLSLLRPHRAPQDEFHMVAALCNDNDWLAIGRGRFILHVYNSKLKTWTATKVSVEDQHFQKYQDQGYFVHQNTRVLAVGGEDATIAFVDLWQGILFCDLAHVKDKPWLSYVPLPGTPSGSPLSDDACLTLDIAVVNGHFKFVRHQLQWKNCPTCYRNEYMEDGWMASIWTRPVSASSLLDDSWQLVCDMESSGMDVKSTPDFELLPKLVASEPFQMLDVSHPTLISHTDDGTVCFMVKINRGDAEAWVIAVDTVNNRLQGLAEFDATRYTRTAFSYLHTRISKYLKKRAPGNSAY
ncbi:unnamed protein product [Urochloa decumbens]|uniref:DUF1618 domain-containing protein n=1 Tax=Urochloa decumbens TaxID=240449 RepID=A0ABC8VLB6_9POAL